MASRTLVVHATDVLARSYLSVAPGRASPQGLPTNALFGTVRTIRRALAFKQPERAVAVVDASEPPADWPADLRSQSAALSELLAEHGLCVVRAEAPLHVVASYVTAALSDGDCMVVGSDKRLAPLVSDQVWWYEGHKDVRYTPEALRKRYGVAPAQCGDWLALVGEEGILEGVPGIGKKGAVSLLQAHGSLTAALADPECVEGRVGRALRAALPVARDQLQRATLRRDLALPVPLSDCAFRAPEAEALNATYRRLGFFSMLAATGVAEARADTRYAVADTPEAVRQVLAQLGTGPVSLQVLTEEPSPVRGELVGLAFSRAPGEAVYVPLLGASGEACLQALAPWLRDAEAAKVGHDTKAAAVALARRQVELRGVVGDSALASHLADPSGMAPHDLHRVARVCLHRALQPVDGLLGRGAKRVGFADLPVARAGAYACHLADAAGQLWPLLGPDDDALISEALQLSETLVRMELKGMPVDTDDLARSSVDFAAIRQELEADIFRLAGKSFAINSTKQLGSVLFEDLGLEVIHRTKTGWSTATHVLQRLAAAHPIVPLVIRWRQLRRLQDSWITALTRAVDDDGRVRSTIHPARSFSGRLINSHPDLGRVPGRTPELARIRHAFRAPEGSVLLSVDYEQLGLYVLAHLTEDLALVTPLSEGADIHRATAAAVLDKPAADVTADERQMGKVVNFATFAGQGPSALALQLGVTPAEAKRRIARFYERYSGVRAFQQAQLAHAREHGFVPTLAGRRWRVGDLASLEPKDRGYAERLAKRGTHEGSVADVTRRGLLHADRALREAGCPAEPLVQIHDEVLFEVPRAALLDAARIASDAMRRAFALRVPLQVSCKAGPSWAELSPLEPVQGAD
ncbi:MAG: hypothetical protein KTR31_15260 [Myxococcales bacterium]|nr:hypothetical protein [Myxococcales bacterium]